MRNQPGMQEAYGSPSTVAHDPFKHCSNGVSYHIGTNNKE